VVLSPQQSVVALLREAPGQSHGVLACVGDALRPQARFAAQSLGGVSWLPGSCTPIPPLADVPVADQAARLRDMDAAALAGELHAAYSSRDFPQHLRASLPRWRAAADQPRRFLNSMADASLDIWAAVKPRWQAAGPLLDREIRRAGTAAVRGAMPALLNSLHPRVSYHDGTFTYTCFADLEVVLGQVGARRLALLPMIAWHDSLLVSFERPEVCYIGYPVRRPAPEPQTTAESPLATILGPVRAAMLRALRQRLTVGDLAAAVHCAPATATYHLHQLAAAGLITREKSGPSVWVTRTARGDELVDVLSS
jgi:DNA-binding transcriptional ArsR family regulator